MDNQRGSTKTRWAQEAFANRRHDFTEKSYSFVKIVSRRNHALANIGEKTDDM